LKQALLRFEIIRRKTRLRATIGATFLPSGAIGDTRKFTERMPACWSYVMTLGRIFIILFFSSLVATGSTLAAGIPKKIGIKGDPPLPASVPAISRHARPQAPIVMGRSESVNHKTKLHHIKMKALESIETPVPEMKPLESIETPVPRG
jgi:hypothetical protein